MNSGCCSGFISLYDQSQVYWEAEVNTMACSSCEGLLQGSGYRNSSRRWLKEFGRRQVRGEEHYHNGNCQLLHQRKRGKSWRDGRNRDQQGAAPAPPSLNQEATCPRLTPSQADRTQSVAGTTQCHGPAKHRLGFLEHTLGPWFGRPGDRRAWGAGVVWEHDQHEWI